MATIVSHPVQRTTAKGDARREQIIAAAIDRLASSGFEGFRVRDVAINAGVHHATLHHYFPTKEDLIEAVVEQILLRFRNQRNEREHQTAPLAALAHHLNSVIDQMARDPAMFIILNEMFVRAQRDPAIAALLKPMQEEWAAYLFHVLKQTSASPALERLVDLTMIALRGLSFDLGARGAFADAKSWKKIGQPMTGKVAQIVLGCAARLLVDD